MIVNYFESSANFDLPPEDALKYFRKKGLKSTFNWFDMLNEQHDHAFTVAKMMDIDLLDTVRQELNKAIAQGSTLKDFKRTLIPTLQKKGWWGKQDIIDPATGLVTKAQLGSASRLELIFRTNLQSSYAAGHWAQMWEQKDQAPYLMYDAVDDSRTRKSHAELDNTVLPITHEFWQTRYPPNGWQCRCGVVQLNADELKEYGLKVSKDAHDEYYKWTHPKTGKTHKLPKGVDPSFNYNSGMAQITNLTQALADKTAKLPPELAIAAKKGIEATNHSAKAKKRAQKAVEKVELPSVDKRRQKQAERILVSELKEIIASYETGINKTLKDALNDETTNTWENTNRLMVIFDHLTKGKKIAPETRDAFIAQFESLQDELYEFVINKTPLSGRLPDKFKAAIRANPDAIRELAERISKQGDLRRFTNNEAMQAIIDHISPTAAKARIPENGSASLQKAFEYLTDYHKRAIAHYTGEHYEYLNRMLYKRELTPEAEAFKELLDDALDRSQKWEGISSRAIKLSRAQVEQWRAGHQKALEEGKPVRYLSFLSSTRGTRAAFTGDVYLEIRGINGVWVNPISYNAGVEDEVLFKSGSQFVVDRIEELSRGRLKIYLTEVIADNIDKDLEFAECLASWK